MREPGNCIGSLTLLGDYMTSFFGGDPSRAHFAVGVKYGFNEKRAERDERRKREWAALEAAGFQKGDKYFQFRVVEKAGKAKAKRDAEAYAKKVKTKTGIELDVNEGCFL
jgi:hypothetical protein